MGKFKNNTTKTSIMKIQNQIEHALKCCVTNGKFALLLFCSIFTLNSCKQKNTEIGTTVVETSAEEIKDTNNEDFFIGRWLCNENNWYLDLYYENDILYCKYDNGVLRKAIYNKQSNEIDLLLDGFRVSIKIDNSHQFLTLEGKRYFKQKYNNSSTNNTKNNESVSATNVSEIKSENSNSNLPFVGKRKFNFAGGSGTEEVIEIKKDGHTIIKSVSNFGEFIDYEGPYKDIIDLAVGDESIIYYKITGNTISVVDANGKKEKNCKDCTASLEEF